MGNKWQEKGFLWHFMSMIYIKNDVVNVYFNADPKAWVRFIWCVLLSLVESPWKYASQYFD